MKQLVITIGTVAAFSLFEAILLTGSMTMNFTHPYAGWYRGFVWWGQWILIPGSAAVMSRSLFGSYGWTGRSLRLFAMGCLVLPMLIVILTLVLSAFEWIFTAAWTSDTPIIVLSSLVVVAIAGISVAVSFSIKRAARRSLEREAQRWLAERQQCPDPVRRLQQRRGRRLIAWVPALTVVLVFLFFPELWGAVSHVSHPGYGKIPGFRFSAPVACIVLDSERFDDGLSMVMGLVGQGIVFAPGRYLRADVPLSAWDLTGSLVGLPTNDLQLKVKQNANAKRTRVFEIGREQLTCWEFNRSSGRRLRYGPPFEIECLGSGRLSAHFAGEADQAPSFYELLNSVRPDQ